MRPSNIFIFAGIGAALACAAFVGMPAHAAHADTPSVVATAQAAAVGTGNATGTSCSPSPDDIAKIVAIENNPTLTASQELQQELAVRKDLVGQTIACAQNEAQTLQAALASTTATSSQGLQSILAGQLNDELNFYSLELQKLNNVGIAGTEEIAQEVLSRRQGTYESLEGQVNNFILWAENQNLFATAETRMDATSREVSFLEGAASNPDLQSAFNAAYASFESAKQENSAAQTALSQFLPPSQSLSLIQESLNSLAGTYQGFFKVSGIIQSILPQ